MHVRAKRRFIPPFLVYQNLSAPYLTKSRDEQLLHQGGDCAEGAKNPVELLRQCTERERERERQTETQRGRRGERERGRDRGVDRKMRQNPKGHASLAGNFTAKTIAET